MKITTQQRLLEVNRAFYATVAKDFDQTRSGLPVGWQQLFQYLPTGSIEQPMVVLDAGCGNGRFARSLAAQRTPACYVGVDVDAALLTFAAQNTADLVNIQTHFIQADLAEPGWSAQVAKQSFDVVACFAVLHHLPGYTLRLQVVQALATRMALGGVLIFSNWQFLTSTRFVQKQIEWQTVGLTAEDVEPRDALLPWQQGGYAVRYVHQVDEEEITQLANAAGLNVIASFLADGKEGNLNLYTVLRQGEIRR